MSLIARIHAAEAEGGKAREAGIDEDANPYVPAQPPAIHPRDRAQEEAIEAKELLDA